MSVPVGKRSLSDLEFYKNAIRLRADITDLLLRDFGVKDKVRDTKILSKTPIMEMIGKRSKALSINTK